MLRSSAAVATKMMRQIGASSRPLILHGRPIAALHINNPLPLLFSDSMPRFPSAFQSRGYARGSPAISSDDDDDDEYEDDDELDEFVDDDGDDFDDDDDDDGDDEYGSESSERNEGK